ncbi:MAG: ethanolamine ammonia-lyase subunit EutB [Prolixibacteraceae bacterium]
MQKYTRRDFLRCYGLATGAVIILPLGFSCSNTAAPLNKPVEILIPGQGEDLFTYMIRIKGKFDQTLYRQIVGSANSFKEGDAAQGLAAFDENSRIHARTLLENTTIKDIYKNPLFTDDILALIHRTTDKDQLNVIGTWTLGELKLFVLEKSEAELRPLMPGLSSDVIGCLVKLMTNEELIRAGQKIFNPLPGSNIGAKGYMGARIQPNSPTDNTDDIMMQVFNGWAYAVGDVVLGTNPVSSEPESVAKIEAALFDVIKTFGLEKTIPNCVLAHIDTQAEAEGINPGTTGIWFQSLGGTVSANETFDLTVEKMLQYASTRTGQYGIYAETGQGADFTNGNGEGFDMVVHESRKYGFLRALKMKIAEVQHKDLPGPWVHVNDVAGFIGPEIFKTKEQLVRCCLEDIVMGKLHGLTIGLDVCSTLHMDVSLDDLAWCIDQIMPANPAYLMALPTKNDPMLSYLTTGFNDHVRVRSKFGYKVNDAMWAFFKKIGIIDAEGAVTEHFGDPLWVYYQYCLAKNDQRSKDEIYAEGRKLITEIEKRGVPVAEGYGNDIWDLEPELDKKIHLLYEDSKKCIWRETPELLLTTVPNAVGIRTNSADRKDYIYHPPTGEELSERSIEELARLRKNWNNKVPDVQIIVSDGLNVSALTDEGHLTPYLEYLKSELKEAGLSVSDTTIVIQYGRVRAGYRCGEYLFGQHTEPDKAKGIIHIIGERPGSGHHNFSAYLSAPRVSTWKEKGKLDHNISKVVSGISDTALKPEIAARETVKIMTSMFDIVS